MSVRGKSLNLGKRWLRANFDTRTPGGIIMGAPTLRRLNRIHAVENGTRVKRRGAEDAELREGRGGERPQKVTVGLSACSGVFCVLGVSALKSERLQLHKSGLEPIVSGGKDS